MHVHALHRDNKKRVNLSALFPLCSLGKSLRPFAVFENGKGFLYLTNANTTRTEENSKKKNRNEYYREYWKKNPDKYHKHREHVKEYLRNRRTDPALRAADRDRDAISRLAKKGYTVLAPHGGKPDEVHRSDDLP